MSDLGAIFHVKKDGVQYDAHAYTTLDECPEPNLKIKFKGSPAYVKLEAKGSGDVPCYVKKSDGGVFQVKKEAVVVPTGSVSVGAGDMFSAYQMAELKAKLEERDRQLMEANILNSQTAQTVDLVQRLRPAPVPAFIVPAPTGTAPTTPTT